MAVKSNIDNNEEPKVYFVVTGFGAFDGVPENPTTALVKRLVSLQKERKEQNDSSSPPILSCCVIETSAEAVRKELDGLYDDLMNGKNENIKNQYAVVVFMHLGVNVCGCNFQLEQFAYNDASFRCPDERGYQPFETKILQNIPLKQSLETQLDLKRIIADLSMEQEEDDTLFSPQPEEITISNDPGRFVCNYIYCYSLDRFRSFRQKDEVAEVGNSETINSNSNNSTTDNENCDEAKLQFPITFRSIFVHVPLFNIIPEERQLKFVLSLMKCIYQQVSERGERTTA